MENIRSHGFDELNHQIACCHDRALAVSRDRYVGRQFLNELRFAHTNKSEDEKQGGFD